MKHLRTSGLLLLSLAGSLSAAPQSFDFKDPKGVNAITFNLDAVVEPISGTANGVTGTVSFDPKDPASITGKITVATSSLATTNSTMTQHLHSDKWLDAAKHPEITFEIAKLDNVKTTGNVTSADASGKLTVKGVTKDVKVPVKITYLEDALGKRLPKAKGDLLVVRGNFKITRNDFQIQAGQNEDKVSNEIDITIPIVGASPKS